MIFLRSCCAERDIELAFEDVLAGTGAEVVVLVGSFSLAGFFFFFLDVGAAAVVETSSSFCWATFFCLVCRLERRVGFFSDSCACSDLFMHDLENESSLALSIVAELSSSR